MTGSLCLPGSGPGTTTAPTPCACCTRAECCTTASTRTRRGSSPSLTGRSSIRSGRYRAVRAVRGQPRSLQGNPQGPCLKQAQLGPAPSSRVLVPTPKFGKRWSRLLMRLRQLQRFCSFSRPCQDWEPPGSTARGCVHAVGSHWGEKTAMKTDTHKDSVLGGEEGRRWLIRLVLSWKRPS